MPDPEKKPEPSHVDPALVVTPEQKAATEALTKENERLRKLLAERPEGKNAEALQRENDLLRDQLSKVPPQGPARGTVVHFRRGKETVCRPALVSSDGFIDSVRTLSGEPRWHAELVYGEPFTEDQRGHSFTTNRGYDPGCSADTWHAPSECIMGYEKQTTFPDPPAPEPLTATIPAQEKPKAVRLPPVPTAP